MVKIRLRRRGTHKKPFYTVVVSDSRRTPRQKEIEILGYFNPFATQEEVGTRVDQQRLHYWLSQGAQMSERVSRIYRRLNAQEASA